MNRFAASSSPSFETRSEEAHLSLCNLRQFTKCYLFWRIWDELTSLHQRNGSTHEQEEHSSSSPCCFQQVNSSCCLSFSPCDCCHIPTWFSLVSFHKRTVLCCWSFRIYIYLGAMLRQTSVWQLLLKSIRPLIACYRHGLMPAPPYI